MRKDIAKDIATALIAISGNNFDDFVFDGCENLITDKEKDKIIHEIRALCNKMLEKIEKKYKITLNVGTTQDVIKLIAYEDKIVCPKCGNQDNFHYNYDYSKINQQETIKNILCNECGEIFI